MNSTKAPALPAELDMPNRLEGLLFLLVASPMTLLGCSTEPLPAETEGSSSGTHSGGTSSGVADSSSGGVGSSSSDDGTTSTGSSSASGSSDSGTTAVPPGTSTGPDDSSSSSSGGGSEESTTGGGGQGNTCERVGDLMDMCFGYGYGYWYEFECTNAINDFLAEGNIACAQAYNELYSCIADLECAEVFNGFWNACAVQYDNVEALECWGSGGSTFGWDTESGNDSGWWGSEDSGWWGGTTGGGWEDSGFTDDGSNFIQPPGSTT